ncbi:MAG TPA: hypothetical protein VE913_22600 [Longimicrobium sp.]|nr:hypothetical protein [Longimicrobium sp.]
MTHRILVAAAAAALACAAPAAAQSTPARPDSASTVRTQAFSILPLHFLFGFYAGDYEHVLTSTTTLGFGASHFSFGGYDDGYDDGDPTTVGDGDGEFNYTTAEAKLRYYPSGDALNGLSFGLTAGPTWVSGDPDGVGKETFTAIGLGFEIARSNTLGVDRRFYYGYGAGAKRLFPVGDSADEAELVIPTLRLSIGVLF